MVCISYGTVESSHYANFSVTCGTPAAVITTTTGATSDYRVGIMPTLRVGGLQGGRRHGGVKHVAEVARKSLGQFGRKEILFVVIETFLRPI